MSENQKKRKIYIGSLLSFLFAGMIGFGHACSQYTADGSGVLGSLGENIIFGEKTTSTVYSKQIIDNFQSCLGVNELSTNNTIRTWNTVKASISETGEASGLNAPMMMAITSVAGEVCRDLISQESGLEPADRKFFSEINFDQRVTTASFDGIAPAINKLARACWQRDETSQEHAEIMNALEESFEANASITDFVMFACAGILASTDSFTF